MDSEMLKKIVRARKMDSFNLEAGIVDSFMNFAKKFKLEFPSKEKALKTLEQYSASDIKEAYAAIPKIVTMFSMKKGSDDEGFFSDIQKKLIKNVMILICLISIAEGMLPQNPNAAEELLQTEKTVYKDMDYIGKISVDEVRGVVTEKDTFEEALNKIKHAIEKKEIAFKGKLPADGKIKLYKDNVNQIKSTKELFIYGGVYFKLAK